MQNASSMTREKSLLRLSDCTTLRGDNLITVVCTIWVMKLSTLFTSILMNNSEIHGMLHFARIERFVRAGLVA